MEPRWRALAFLLVPLLGLALGACGSSSSSSTSGSTSAAGSERSTAAESGAHTGDRGGKGDSAGGGTGSPGKQGPGAQGSPGKQAEKAAAEEPAFKPRHHHDSGGGPAQFEAKGGDNSIAEFGGEGSGSEFDEAAAALHGYLDARAERAWAAACGYLAAGLTRELGSQLGEARGDAGPSCAELLAGLSGGVPDSALREAAVADVGALRTEGDRAFLLFHGAGNTAYFIPMVREDGRWKVAAIAASAAP